MAIFIIKQATTIIDILEKNGYEAYAVGGCVRDLLTNKVPKDWDITTNALPCDVVRCFQNEKIIETGLKHGTVTVFIDNMAFEITTYRIDGDYSDNRRPDEVRFINDLKQDLSRRDFTMNAMAYHPLKGLIDPYGGKIDIDSRIIRCVGNADDRFKEDALRIMRALRFSSELSFSIEKQTALSIHRNKKLLKNIACERFAAEFNQLLTGNNAETILLEFSDVPAVMIPEMSDMIGFEQNNPHHNLDVWQHTVRSIAESPKDIILRLTMFFHDIAKPEKYFTDNKGVGHFYGHPKRSAEIADIVMRRLKYDMDTLNQVKLLVLNHDNPILLKEIQIKKWLNKIGEEMLRKLFSVKRADAYAQNPAFTNDRIDEINEAEKLLNKIINENQCFCLNDLAVNGNDLIDAGIKQGKQIGSMLQTLLSLVINEQLENDKETLLEKGIQLYKKPH